MVGGVGYCRFLFRRHAPFVAAGTVVSHLRISSQSRQCHQRHPVLEFSRVVIQSTITSLSSTINQHSPSSPSSNFSSPSTLASPPTLGCLSRDPWYRHSAVIDTFTALSTRRPFHIRRLFGVILELSQLSTFGIQMSTFPSPIFFTSSNIVQA